MRKIWGLACLGLATAAKKERDPLKGRSVFNHPLYRCVEPAVNTGAAPRYAYAVMMGPISAERKYSKWLYPILALRRALLQQGSRADLLVIAALDDGSENERMLPAEEAMLAAQSIRWRYVPAPGLRGFHMGHYKLWAWQHTEYDRIQVLDADVLPLVNMDELFRLPVASDFVGCPGQFSVLNAGWFSLRPDCAQLRVSAKKQLETEANLTPHAVRASFERERL